MGNRLGRRRRTAIGACVPRVKDSYLSDARSFIAASRAAGVPAAVCSTLPENLDRTTREMLVAVGVAPMQGLREALDAAASVPGRARARPTE